MSNLGRQFTVYRGLSEDIPMRHVKDSPSGPTSGLGMHWSTNRKVAQRFAEGGGTVVHATLPESSTYAPGSDEWERMAQIHGVEERRGWEKEITAKPNAPLLVTAVTHLRKRGPRKGLKARTIKVSPPREMKA